MHIRLTTVQLTLAFLFATSASQAQVNVVKVDSTSQKKEAMQFEMKDGKMVNIADSLAKLGAEEEKELEGKSVVVKDSKDNKPKRDWKTWAPDPKRAMWLALVLPGAGQIYNRKYWKLPIIYGGFVGCIYAMQWNNQMFHDYSQAYIDIMDNDPNTQSYNQFLHLGNKITAENEERYKNLFKRRKDYYRRYRDLSFFCLIGVYALSVIDAYVDASLSQFDISKDLTMRVAPEVITDKSALAARNPIKSSAVGIQCSLNF